MDDFKIFLKETKKLLLILFCVPILVLAFFAFNEYCLGKPMYTGDWAQLWGTAFAYWGTVILGTLAFWQNNQLQKSNEELREKERKQRAPALQPQYYNASTAITFEIHSISHSIARFLVIQNLVANIYDKEKLVETKEYPLCGKIPSHILAFETKQVEFSGSPVSDFQNMKLKNGKMVLNLSVTAENDMGEKWKSTLTMKMNDYVYHTSTNTYSFEEIIDTMPCN